MDVKPWTYQPRAVGPRTSSTGRWLVAAALVVAVSIGFLAAWWLAQRPPELSPRVSENLALEYFSSKTDADWARRAEYVVVARVEEEHEVDLGSGRAIGRTVDLRIRDAVWSNEPTHDLPDDVSLTTPGWAEEGKALRPLAYARQPRLEPGRDYLIALVSMSSQCSVGDQPEPARWMPVGSSAVLPFDGGRVGHGESEGSEVAGDRSQAEPDSLELTLMGQGADSVNAALQARATAGVERQPTAPSTC